MLETIVIYYFLIDNVLFSFILQLNNISRRYYAQTYDRFCVCIPILVTTFSEWLSGTEPFCTHKAPCVRPRCVCSVLRAQFCRFDKADVTADVQ